MPRVDDGYGNAATTRSRPINNVRVRDISTQADPAQLAQQAQLTRAQAAVAGQNFTPRSGQRGGLLTQAIAGPVAPIAQAFMDETRYGMNDRAQAAYDNQQAVYDLGGEGMNPADMSPAQRVQLARSGQMNEQLPHAMNSKQRSAAGLPDLPRGDGGMQYHTLGPKSLEVQGPSGGATIPNGGSDTGTFKPITFRSGAGTSVLDESGLSTSLGEDYAGLSGLVGQGTGLMGEAAGMAQQAPNEFNYNFDPSGAAQSLFNERSALLEPAFAQQRAKNMEQMQGMGRIGLSLAGEGLGAGSGMMNPDMFGMNQAQSGALAQLSAQSTQDAFGQEMQRAGLDMSQFGANQQAQQQQYANLMGSGTGMLSAGMGGAALENQLAGIPMTLAGLGQQQQGLDQSYEMGNYQNATQRMLAEAKIAQGNVQDNGWLTGLTSLGSSFLGTKAGGDWLSDGFSKGGWFS